MMDFFFQKKVTKGLKSPRIIRQKIIALRVYLPVYSALHNLKYANFITIARLHRCRISNADWHMNHRVI